MDQKILGPENRKPKKRKGCLLWLLVIGTAYVLLTLWAQWTPPVRGIVVDAETGKPIEGVEIIRQGQGGTIAPTEKACSWTGNANHAKTGGDGTFRIHGTLKGGLDGYIMPAPIVWIDEMGIYADNPEYICSKSPYGKTHPADVSGYKAYKPTSAGWEEGKSPHGKAYYERRKLWFFRGYEFKIRLTRAKTEEDWRLKCGCAIDTNSNSVMSALTEEWLFNDLVGYLERFPNGERAGDYGLLLLDKLAIGDSRTNIDEELHSGDLDRMKMKLILERNKKIIEVTSKVTLPEHSGVVVTFSDYKQRQESVKKCTSYLQEIYEKGGNK